MVEFDVQVSKDLVPVIYHEFRLCVQTRSKQGGLKSFGNEAEEAHQAFPKLEDILDKLDQHC